MDDSRQEWSATDDPATRIQSYLDTHTPNPWIMLDQEYFGPLQQLTTTS